jgi:mannose-6-phosphate isomerase-like protein (cupin superfamily)
MDTNVITMAIIRKNALSPDETMSSPNGRVEIVRLGERTVARITLQPGWKWSKDVQPKVGTELCEVPHSQYVISGRLMIELEDGTRMEVSAGDFVEVPPGHDAWVMGREPFVAIDFGGQMKDYAKPQSAPSVDWRHLDATAGLSEANNESSGPRPVEGPRPGRE